MTPFSSMARNWSSRDADFSGGSGEHLEHHRERAQPRGADRVLPLRRANLGIVGLHLVQLAGLEGAHLPRQGVRR